MKTGNLSRFSAVGVVGGDGSFNEVITGMLSRKDGFNLPIGFIPGGTGNSLWYIVFLK